MLKQSTVYTGNKRVLVAEVFYPSLLQNANVVAEVFYTGGYMG